MSSENKLKRARYCVAPGCKNFECALKKVNDSDDKKNQDQTTITYHNFPTKASLRNKWFKFVGHKKNVSSLTWRTWTLCSEHFENSEFEESCHLECIDGVYRRLNIKLKNGAVPTKSMPPPSPPPTTTTNDLHKQTEEITNSIDFTRITATTTTDSKESINNNTTNSYVKNEYSEIDFDNETIYTEIDEDFHSKCGEVFVTRNGIFLYFCTFCNENLENSDKFITHIHKEHLSLDYETEINNTNSSTNNIIKNNDERIKLSQGTTTVNTIKVPLPLQHCEIVENEAGNFETISFFDDDDNCDINNESTINQNLYAEIQAKKTTTEEFKKPKIKFENYCTTNPLLNIAQQSSQNNDYDIFIDLTDDDNIDVNNEDDRIPIKNEAVFDTINPTVDNISISKMDTSDKSTFSDSVINNFISTNNNNQINDNTLLIDNQNSDYLKMKEIPNSIKDNNQNKEEILPAAYNDKEYVEADDDDIIGNDNDEEDDDWDPINHKRFKCKHCPKILKSQFSLTIHTRSHTGERPFKCNICSRSFKSQGILYNHEKIHTGVKPFGCTICGLHLSTQYSLNIHTKRHETQPNQYKCAYCDKKFLRLKKKVLHQRTHNIDIKHDPDEEISLLTKNFKCEFCLKVLSSQYSLIEHRRIHTGERPFPCKFCPSAFRSKLLKICHERSNHTGERPFSCIYCDKAFATKSTRDNHERTHTNERPFKCDLCDKTYRQASAKYMHMKTHFKPKRQYKNNRSRINSAGSSSVQGDNTTKIYQCEFCQKILSTQCILNEHRRIHTGEKPFSCNQCTMRFRAKSLLFYHIQTHTGEKAYECKYCQKRFRFAGNLIVHLRIHTGEKPFRCSYCDKCFRQKQGQSAHEKTHIPGYKKEYVEKEKENRIWKCDICGKQLINKYTLTNHIRTHTGERPYKCTFCPSAFKSLSQHTQHERIHSGLKPFKCSECDKGFKTKSQMNAHLRTHAARKLRKTIHKCGQCGKEFKFNSNLIIHQRSHIDRSEI